MLEAVQASQLTRWPHEPFSLIMRVRRLALSASRYHRGRIAIALRPTFSQYSDRGDIGVLDDGDPVTRQYRKRPLLEFVASR